MTEELNIHNIYVPKSSTAKLEKARHSLYNIDCNLSRLLVVLLDSIISIVKLILKQNKNFRHYHWSITIKDKKTGETFNSQNIKKRKRKK